MGYSGDSAITSILNGYYMKRWYIGGDYTISPDSDRNLVLDAEDEKIEVGTRILVYKKNGQRNQQFYFIHSVYSKLLSIYRNTLK